MRMQVVARGCGLTFHPVFLCEALPPFYLNHFELPHLLLVKIEHWLECFLGWHEVWMARHWRSSCPIQTIYEVLDYSADVHKMNLGGRVCGWMVCSVNFHQVKKGLMLLSHILCQQFPQSVDGFSFHIRHIGDCLAFLNENSSISYHLCSYISKCVFFITLSEYQKQKMFETPKLHFTDKYDCPQMQNSTNAFRCLDLYD